MEALHTLEIKQWADTFSGSMQSIALSAIETGQILYFPTLKFSVTDDEQKYLAPLYADPKSKNISFNLHNDTISGVIGSVTDQEQIKKMMQRFSSQAIALVQTLLPHYKSAIQLGRTSFRPVEISGRQSSYRKDDTRLHVDAFPSSPNQGKRILRVFSNINPHGKDRHWRVGESFENVAKTFLPKIKPALPGVSALLKTLKITKTKRTPYDHIMLRMHDMMKADLDYQKNVAQTAVSFPAGCSWIVMTDQVSHAAMSGQFCLEQTFYLPVEAMHDEQHSPLRTLERLLKRKLV